MFRHQTAHTHITFLLLGFLLSTVVIFNYHFCSFASYTFVSDVLLFLCSVMFWFRTNCVSYDHLLLRYISDGVYVYMSPLATSMESNSSNFDDFCVKQINLNFSDGGAFLEFVASIIYSFLSHPLFLLLSLFCMLNFNRMSFFSLASCEEYACVFFTQHR